MQPILLLVIAGVGVAALSTGFLGNVINLSMVQDFGVGETNIESQIDNAYIDFVIDRTTFTINTNDKLTRNVIDQCEISADRTISKDSTIICKLTDANNNVVAEGRKVLSTQLPANTGTVVDINMLVDPNAPSNDVTNIHDVILVVQGPGFVTVP